MPKLNQKYIADRLDLSRTTVSRCFTNHPRINPETRARVFKLAAEMGYSYTSQRNVASKKLAGRKRISVLVGMGEAERAAHDTGIAEGVLSGISAKAAAEKLEIEVHYVDPADFLPPPRARRIIRNVSCLDWKGIVLIHPLKEEAVRNLMAKFPTVSALEDYDACDVDCINLDAVRGISRIMERLVSLGHRRIGFLSWKYKVHAPWVERRLGAYVENLYRLGLDLDPSLILNLRPDEQLSADALADIAAQKVRDGAATAWVCAADHQAYQLISDLAKRGLRVPEDCSVTGFDGAKPPAGARQATTIRVPFRDIGISAVSALLRKIDHPNASRRHVHVAGELVPGETSAPPPASGRETEG